MIASRSDEARQRALDIRRFEQRRAHSLTPADLHYLIEVAHVDALRTPDPHARQLKMSLVEKLARMSDQALEVM